MSKECKDKQDQLLRLFEKTPMPLSIEYVARHLNVGWGTARAMLLELALDGKIAYQKTTKSWIFWLENDRLRVKNVHPDEHNRRA